MLWPLLLSCLIHPHLRLSARFKALALLFGALGAVDVFQVRPSGMLSEDTLLPLVAAEQAPPAPLAEGDDDRDGILDDREMELSRRYAPIVILDRRDPHRPASIPWLLERHDIVRAAAGSPALSDSPPFSTATRSGSDDPADWTTYVHVYPRADGGMNLQYWFFYPYNDGPWRFDHEGDWEHLTVRLDASGAPTGAYLARHNDDNPGVYHGWDSLRKDGDHIVVLSAQGLHATYASEHDLPWYEQAGSCADLEACDEPVWRTWEGGGLVNTGELTRPLGASSGLAFPGRWGAPGILPGTSAPRGPLFHDGFTHAGFDAHRPPPETYAQSDNDVE